MGVRALESRLTLPGLLRLDGLDWWTERADGMVRGSLMALTLYLYKYRSVEQRERHISMMLQIQGPFKWVESCLH